MPRADWQSVLTAAEEEDRRDSLSRFRQEFHVPVTATGEEQVYLLGNSLGLQPRRAEAAVREVLQAWSQRAAAAHFTGEFPWMPYHEVLSRPMADLVGAAASEVVMMNSLTVNLHLMLATFYTPTPERHQILIESHAFPSDRYAVCSQLRWHQRDPAASLLEIPLAELGDPDQVCAWIDRHARSLSVVLLPGVQYYTGQRLDARPIVREAHRHGILVGLDLAHAVGNVPLSLHDDGIDFAVWCTYKYLNSGPGSVGGCFVHERHLRTERPRLAGWWGHDKSSRFQMPAAFQPIPTAEGWQLSNPPILSLAAIRAALDVFTEAGGMAPLRAKSQRLTSFLERLLDEHLPRHVRSITPRAPDQRGCQLSLVVAGHRDRDLAARLEERGVITDWREPDVLRVAPVPLYNSFVDVARFVMILSNLLAGPGDGQEDQVR